MELGRPAADKWSPRGGHQQLDSLMELAGRPGDNSQTDVRVQVVTEEVGMIWLELGQLAEVGKVGGWGYIS